MVHAITIKQEMNPENRFKRDSRSRSRSPFRKTFNERANHDDDFKYRRNEPDPTGNMKRIFVNNIPFECRWMEIKDLFREKVGDVAFVELCEDDNGKFKGYGIVEFKTTEAAKKAVEIMHKHEVRGRQLLVKMDTFEYNSNNNNDRRRPPPRPMEREPMPRSMHSLSNNEFNRWDPPYNTYGLNPEFLKSLGISGPLSNKVFISNLDYKVNEKKLEEVFKIAGKLVKVDLNTDDEGKSKGHGTAEYEHPLGAVQAISMFNGQRLFARIINVRMDKFSDDSDSIPNKLPVGLHGIGKGLGMNGQPMQFNKDASNVSNNFGFGMGMGSSGVSSGLSSGGLGSSFLSSSMGLGSSGSLGLGSSLGPSDRMMGLGASGPASLSMLGRSTLDSLDSSYPLSGLAGRSSSSYRDHYDRVGGPDAFNNSSLSDTILLGNLPSSFNWPALKDRLRNIGEITFAELKGQGNALVRFANITDAQHAVELMNGYRVEGRALQATYY